MNARHGAQQQESDMPTPEHNGPRRTLLLTGASRRLLELVCTSEVVRLRSRPGPFDWLSALRERRLRDLALYPLSGESTLKLVDLSPNTLVGMMAAKYRPHVTAYALPGHEQTATAKTLERH